MQIIASGRPCRRPQALLAPWPAWATSTAPARSARAASRTRGDWRRVRPPAAPANEGGLARTPAGAPTPAPATATRRSPPPRRLRSGDNPSVSTTLAGIRAAVLAAVTRSDDRDLSAITRGRCSARDPHVRGRGPRGSAPPHARLTLPRPPAVMRRAVQGDRHARSTPRSDRRG